MTDDVLWPWRSTNSHPPDGAVGERLGMIMIGYKRLCHSAVQLRFTGVVDAPALPITSGFVEEASHVRISGLSPLRIPRVVVLLMSESHLLESGVRTSLESDLMPIRCTETMNG
jgi:hypothetical protein